jgi:CHAT domain-containing protein
MSSQDYSVMDLDPRIFFIIVIPDGDPKEATPTQGFAPSLVRMSWIINAAAHLPTSVHDLTDEGRETLLIRRMSGIAPVRWFGQSPSAIRSRPHPAFIPFTVIALPESEKVADYEEWAKSSSVRPTIVAKSGGDLDALSLEAVQAQFLKVCDRIPDSVSRASVEAARAAIKAWKPMPSLKTDYQVGGHNTIAPNIASLTAAGFDDMVSGRFADVGSGLKPYVEQIVKTTNTVLDERTKVGERDLQRIFRPPPDLNLFAPAIYPKFFEQPLSIDVSPAERREFQAVRQALERQTGYGFDIRSSAQKAALLGKLVEGNDGGAAVDPNPLVRLRASELLLDTELMCALTASEFSACVRLPNEINRTSGSVRNFAEHYRSNSKKPRKRLLAFRQVQARLAGAVPKDFVPLVRRSATGLRIVCDAHLEWLDLDGLPLFIRKNCSRIPVTPGNLFVDHLASKGLIHLTPGDFETVLVISALERSDPINGIFEKAFDAFEPEWRKNLTLSYVKVTSDADLVKALNDFKGPMVIFDGHGSHTRDEPAVLHLGQQAVDVWSLRDRIQNIAPIVILSACDTHAADRNHATTANGFMSLGARAVLSSVFPLDARAAAIFAARLVYRISEFVPAAIEQFNQAITWTEVVAGMLRMQLLTDFLHHLLNKKAINEELYVQIHTEGNHAINGRVDDPFSVVMDALENVGQSRSSLKLDLELAVANSSVISYLLVGRPETILIDKRERIAQQARLIGDHANG